MRYQKYLIWIIPLIGLLALFAAGMGLFYDTPGQSYAYVSLRNEQVTITGHGLYQYDTLSSTAQMQANDLVTLVLGLPLLVISTLIAFRSKPGGAWSLRGRFLLAGTLAFFLYTYMSMATNTQFNALFPVYVALFSLSLVAFVQCLLAFDLESLPSRFTERLPRGWIAGLLIATGSFLLLAWMGGRILPPILNGSVPPMQNTTTMVIQFMDLGLIFPLALLGGILLLRRSPWGYLLSSVAVMKMLTMGIAVSAMGANELLQGVSGSAPLVAIFMTLTLTNIFLAVLLLRNIQPEPNKRMVGNVV